MPGSDPAPGTAALGAALAEVGRIIESMPPSERKLDVARHVASMTEAQQRDFLIGVFVWAHAQQQGGPDGT